MSASSHSLIPSHCTVMCACACLRGQHVLSPKKTPTMIVLTDLGASSLLQLGSGLSESSGYCAPDKLSKVSGRHGNKVELCRYTLDWTAMNCTAMDCTAMDCSDRDAATSRTLIWCRRRRLRRLVSGQDGATTKTKHQRCCCARDDDDDFGNTQALM